MKVILTIFFRRKKESKFRAKWRKDIKLKRGESKNGADSIFFHGLNAEQNKTNKLRHVDSILGTRTSVLYFSKVRHISDDKFGG